jgi:hypothetical protein
VYQCRGQEIVFVVVAALIFLGSPWAGAVADPTVDARVCSVAGGRDANNNTIICNFGLTSEQFQALKEALMGARVPPRERLEEISKQPGSVPGVETRVEIHGDSLNISEEKTWISPQVTADMPESQAKSLLEAGKTAAVGAQGCFVPPDTPPTEKARGNWRFMPETASVIPDQHSCNSGQANIGGGVINNPRATNICLDVSARPAQQGVYHCTTAARIQVKVTRPGY